MRQVRVDQVGKTFGKLTVVARAANRGWRLFWLCRCECGNEVEIRSDTLPVRTDCGCELSKKLSSLIDLRGSRFGRLVVLDVEPQKAKVSHKWLCRCECGKEAWVQGNNLRSGKTKSCGCIQREKAAQQAKVMGHANTTHGRTASSEYLAWHNMWQRCENPKAVGYSRYGARGIKVCERWQTFENFFADMGPKPSPDHSIDRYPDQNGNYEPENCRWATEKEQQRNRSDNVLLEFDGRVQCISAWAEEKGLSKERLWTRLKNGWSVEDAIMTPVDKTRVAKRYRKQD